MSAHLDAEEVEITPVFRVYPVGRDLDLRELHMRPGRIIPVDGTMLHPFKRNGNTVWMSLESAHDARIIGCFHYQWLRLLNYLKRYDL